MEGFGFDLAVVEKRCRACPDKSDPDWACMSSTGFLAPSESLVQVLQHDADALSRVLHSAKQVAKELRELLALLTRGEEEQTLHWRGRVWHVKRTWFVAEQFSPFREQGGKHGEGWSEEWKLRSQDGLNMVLTRGVVDMIEDFGFFEGGLDGSNRYRIDPDVAVAAISGSPLSKEGQEYLQQRKAFKAAKKQQARQELIEAMQTRMHEPGAKEFLEYQLKKLA